MSQDNFNVLDVEALMDECLIAKKIYGRCKQQDCLKPVDYDTPTTDVADYIKISSSYYGGASKLSNVSTATAPLSGVINAGQTITLSQSVAKIEFSKPYKTTINVVQIAAPGQFSLPGYYDVTIQYTFAYNLSLLDSTGTAYSVLVDSSTTPTTTFPAYSVYTKTVSLEGGAVDPCASVAIYDSGNEPCSTFTNIGNKPYAYVQAIANPLVAKVGKYLTSPSATTFEYHADVVIGLFTIIELYRYASMTVASNGPIEVPQCQPSINNDPCEGFNQLLFPYDDFDPPFRKC